MDFVILLLMAAIFAAGYYAGVQSYKRRTRYAADEVPERGWRCPACGKTHHSYDVFCECGYSIAANNNAEQASDAGPLEDDAINDLRKYKALLDEGILTQEEFDAKKKQLLSL